MTPQDSTLASLSHLGYVKNAAKPGSQTVLADDSVKSKLSFSEIKQLKSQSNKILGIGLQTKLQVCFPT
jgi:hypothetical protein